MARAVPVLGSVPRSCLPRRDVQNLRHRRLQGRLLALPHPTVGTWLWSWRGFRVLVGFSPL